MKRASEKDIRKLIELIRDRLSTLSKVAFSGKYSDLSEKATAADVGALPVKGGTVTNSGDISVIKLFSNYLVQDSRYIGGFLLGANNKELVRIQAEEVDGGVAFWIQDQTLNKDIFKVSSKEHWIRDGGVNKNILLEGNYIKPTVKTTRFAIKDGNLKVKGTKSNADTDITEIVKKAYTGSEGMAVGIATNGMGYIVAQNFFIDCSLITDDERKLIQSFDSIKIEKANDSSDYPTLMPAESDYEVGVSIRGKSGYIDKNVKMGIRSNNSTNYFYYTLPSEFKNDDNSSNNLRFATKEWVTFVGIDVKSR